MEQIHFEELDEHLYEIDERLTIKEAQRILKRYRNFKLGLNVYDTKTTSTYSIEPRSFSNQFNSNVENNVIRKLDYMQTIEHAVNKIPDADERRILVEGYMGKTKHNWIKMSQSLLISKTDYYKKRNAALVSFACALNKEVLKYN